MTKFANIDLATNITVEEQHIVALVQFLRSIQSLRIVPTQEDDTDCEPLDLSRFEGLNSLRIDRCDIRLVQGLSRISSGLRHFACVRVAPKGLAISLEDILVLALQDQYMDTLSLDADIIQRVALQWPLLVRLECVDCGLEAIDESVLGLKSVQVLNFSKNRLKKVPNLQTLPQLQALDLSHNQISDVRDVATMVGNVAQLTLRHNALQNLNGLHRLYSVEKLDLGENKISKLSDVRQLRRLELLHELWLDGNPVSRMSNFRHLTAAMFENTAKFVLDGRNCTVRPVKARMTITTDRPSEYSDAINGCVRKRVDNSVMISSPRSEARDMSFSPVHSDFAESPGVTSSPVSAVSSNTRRRRRIRQVNLQTGSSASQRNVRSGSFDSNDGDSVVSGAGAGPSSSQGSAPKSFYKNPESSSLENFEKTLKRIESEGGDSWLVILGEFEQQRRKEKISDSSET